MAKTALGGVKVVEYAGMVAGPYCGKLLADLGADVIKVEPPAGDPARQCGPFPEDKPHPEKSALFLYNNTSKRGITCDPEKPEGLDVLQRLIRWADVLIDNYPPHHLAKLGLDWPALQKLNPRLIYTSITPYGRTGPRSQTGGDELTLVHAGGLGNLLPTRSEDIARAPVKPGGYFVGYHAGITAALATLGALIGRMKTGQGRLIDISMQEVVLGLVRPNVTGSRHQRSTWHRVPDRPPATGRMQTSDGYIVLGAVEDHHFRILRELMGNPPWLTGDDWLSMAYRAHHIMEVAARLDEWMSRQKKDEIHYKLAEKGVPLGPVNSVKDLLEDGQYASREYFVQAEHPVAGSYRYAGWPYRMSTSPRLARPVPLLGQHNREVLCQILGYSAEEYEHLCNAGAAGGMR